MKSKLQKIQEKRGVYERSRRGKIISRRLEIQNEARKEALKKKEIKPTNDTAPLVSKSHGTKWQHLVYWIKSLFHMN